MLRDLVTVSQGAPSRITTAIGVDALLGAVLYLISVWYCVHSTGIFVEA